VTDRQTDRLIRNEIAYMPRSNCKPNSSLRTSTVRCMVRTARRILVFFVSPHRSTLSTVFVHSLSVCRKIKLNFYTV